MAKKINTDEIDEQFIISAVKKDRIPQVSAPPPLTPLPATAATQSVQPEKTEEQTPQFPKEDSPKEETPTRREKQQKYESLFIRESDLPPARFGKSVYIRKAYHDRISQIISVIGGNEVSLFGYIDNVLTHHFENFGDEITQSFKKNTIFK
jgi:hypothetical protein